jgi:hypothetical protein
MNSDPEIEKMFLLGTSFHVDRFKELKLHKRKHLLRYYACPNGEEVLNLIVSDFYEFFYKKDFENIQYLVYYFIFQSGIISSPKDFYLLFIEDVFQTLVSNSFFSMIRYLEKYFSNFSISKRSESMDVKVVIVKNFSRFVSMEFQNIKRVMETEEKKPCSIVSNNSFPHDTSFDEFYFIEDSLYEKKTREAYE